LTFDDEGQPFLAFSPAVEIDVVKLYCKDHEHPVTVGWVDLAERAIDFVNASLHAAS
jgi:hypothetical protein